MHLFAEPSLNGTVHDQYLSRNDSNSSSHKGRRKGDGEVCHAQ